MIQRDMSQLRKPRRQHLHDREGLGRAFFQTSPGPLTYQLQPGEMNVMHPVPEADIQRADCRAEADAPDRAIGCPREMGDFPMGGLTEVAEFRQVLVGLFGPGSPGVLGPDLLEAVF